MVPHCLLPCMHSFIKIVFLCVRISCAAFFCSVGACLDGLALRSYLCDTKACFHSIHQNGSPAAVFIALVVVCSRHLFSGDEGVRGDLLRVILCCVREKNVSHYEAFCRAVGG